MREPSLLPPWRGSTDLPNVSSAVASAVASSSSCVPDGAVVLTYFNLHHTSLRALQLQRVRSEACLLARLVSVCYGVHEDGLGRCVRGRPIPPSNYRHAAYVELTWAKWRIIHEALHAARTVLFLDADVVLFRNPFALLSPTDLAYDVRFQAELACAPPGTCATQPGWRAPAAGVGMPPWPCSLNGGVLLVRSARLAARIIRKHEPDFRAVAASAPIDQDAADAVANGGGFSSCALPSQHFVGFCMWAWGYNKGNRTLFDALRPCELATYHAHCINTAEGKAASMQRMLDKTRHCDRAGGGGGGSVGGGRLGRWGPRAQPQPAPAARAARRGG